MFMCVCMCMGVCVGVGVCACVYLCMSVYVCVCMHVCMCVLSICTHLHWPVEVSHLVPLAPITSQLHGYRSYEPSITS